MHLSLFDYDLPDELIAHAPAERRDLSRLMKIPRHFDRDLVAFRSEIRHDVFTQLLDHLSPGDLLIMNNTRVLSARIYARKPTGGRVELLFLHPHEGHPGQWLAMSRASRPVKPGTLLQLPGQQCEIVERKERGQVVVQLDPALDLIAYLGEHGELPLPPYIRKEEAATLHSERYQTVFAKEPGAIAAPTAGLHFTRELLSKIEAAGVKTATVTLHVGMGTFLPVRTDNIVEHKMHTEWYEISEETAELHKATRESGGRVIAIGTTSMRALESSAQRNGVVTSEQAETDIFIFPGYEFLAVDGLLTNFHLPKSTLLMLVSAFCGRERILEAYKVAVEEGYRFFSYGDAMLILD
ncbi:MAG: tRNA preQ1(34) S-adenosylmethionine ribosyltransferase-isomerase QueA [Deltaproteobacteria bacterium]|nr:tRNA preQ1(34) S-adenosylmethionine ribosyltransferase-isomerase QueA [Deltaproteobacteria bacterium]